MEIRQKNELSRIEGENFTCDCGECTQNLNREIYLITKAKFLLCRRIQ